jgi:hypothetical protein
VDDDVDDGDVQYTVVTTVTSVSDPVYDGLPADDVTVWNLDDDTAAIFVSSISGDTSETGTTATFSLVLGSEPTAEVTIGVSSDDPSEGSLAVTSVIFTPANWDVAQMITVTGVDDDLDDGDIGYQILTAAAASLDTVYDGMDPDDVAVTNRDDQSDGLSWQNPIHPCDINNDGFITVADILVLITDINSNGTRQLPMPPTPPNAPPPYLDPSGDDAVTPEDILVVINYINENGPGPVVPLGTGDSGDGFTPGTPGLPDGEGEGPVDLSQRMVAAAAPPTTGETGLSSPGARSQDDPPGTTGWLDPRSTANAPTPITRPDLRPERVPSFRSTDEDHASDHRSERNVDLLMTTGGDDDLAFVGESELDGTLADIADHVNRV